MAAIHSVMLGCETRRSSHFSIKTLADGSGWLAWKSFPSECWSPRSIAYTQSQQKIRDPGLAVVWSWAGWVQMPCWPGVWLSVCSCPLASLHISQLIVCCEFSSSLPFSVSALFQGEMDLFSTSIPSFSEPIFPFPPALLLLSLETWLLEERSDVLCQGTSLFLVWFSFFFLFPFSQSPCSVYPTPHLALCITSAHIPLFISSLLRCPRWMHPYWHSE